MRIGIITDGGRLLGWQAAALERIAPGNVFLHYSCRSRVVPKRSVRRHGAYYALNLLALRRATGPEVALPAGLQLAGSFDFEAEADGGWDRLPQILLDRIAADAPDVIVKFGLGLLRVPTAEQLKAPILSYHHGDPRRFRGRPAGLWEMVEGAPVMGQIIQRLSNRLDAGQVLAFAETRVVAHSWRRTMAAAYAVSPLLLGPAIARVGRGHELGLDPSGPNYRLPDNRTVLSLLARMAAAKMRWLGYGLTTEKQWRVATAPLPAAWSPEAPDALDKDTKATDLVVPPGFTFLADPFFAPDGAILAEAMRPDGKGTILYFDSQGSATDLRLGEGHCSYPSTFDHGGRTFMLPETSDWTGPRLYELRDGAAIALGPLDFGEEVRLLDPTVHVEGDGFYLFANRADEGAGVLRLWTSPALRGPYAEHPASPILISPLGARMAGPLFRHASSLYRAGQDFSGAYGDGLLLFRIEALDPLRYEEKPGGRLRFTGRRGPHTLSIRQGTALFDHYSEVRSPLAALRRLRQSRG